MPPFLAAFSRLHHAGKKAGMAGQEAHSTEAGVPLVFRRAARYGIPDVTWKTPAAL
jgi:hypothetical protein